MTKLARLAFFLCLAPSLSVTSHAALAVTMEQKILARLNALERENAALRARVRRLEASRAAKIGRGAAHASRSRQPKVVAAVDATAPRKPFSPSVEISGSLLYLKPSTGNLEYGTLVTPLPLVSPGWENQALDPDYSPAFGIGVRYIANEWADFAVNWTHLRSTADASVSAMPTQMVGPPFLVGPESALYKRGDGSVDISYDSVTLEARYNFCNDCVFQFRAFGGLEYARIGEDLTGTFQSPNGAASMSSTTHSRFSGIGPRLGIKGQYALGDFSLLGELAGAALIGTSETSMNFTTVAPALTGPNNQSLTSPDATRARAQHRGQIGRRLCVSG
jgi:hypothetical protein